MKQIEIDVFRKGEEIGKNFFCAGACFIIFAALVVTANVIVSVESYAYILGAVIFSLATLGAKLIFPNFLRGFPVYSTFLILPSLAFPLDDLGYLPAEDVTILVALLIMAIAMVVIGIRVVRFARN